MSTFPCPEDSRADVAISVGMGSIVADKTPLAKSPASPYFMKTALWIMPLKNSCMAGNIFSSNFLHILTFGYRTDNACTCSYQDFSGLLL
jgi:hypothetical protein